MDGVALRGDHDTGGRVVLQDGPPGEIANILRLGKGPVESEKWAKACMASGECIKACDYGVNPRFLLTITDQYGTVDQAKAKAAGYVLEDGEAWITKEADVLIPAAIEGHVNTETIKKMSSRIRIIAEGANGPTTPEADEYFKQNKIFLIPDFLCNAGGVTTSYFEGVQNDMNFYWSKKEVLSRLDEKMTVAFHDVLHMSEKEKTYMRDAAYLVSIQRVVNAMQMRGWLHADW